MLLELAKKKFAPANFSRAEKELFRAAQTGETASARSGDKMQHDPASAGNWHADRVVRAEYIAWLSTDREASALVTHRGIQIIGMRIDGKLDLNHAEIKFPFRISNSAFTGHILLQDTQLPFLSLQGCHINELHGDRLKVPGSVCLGSGFKAQGEVRLLGATIGGDLDCDGAQFSNSNGDALSADGVQIKGDALLGNGFKAEGGVRLLGATIGGNLDCMGAQFSNSNGYALQADHVEIKGDAFLGNGFKGEVRLLGAAIGGNLDCDGAQFSNSNGDALSADGVQIKGDAFLGNGFKAEGGVRLLGAVIGGDLDCMGAQFSNSNGDALSADGVQIKGDALLGNGFKAEGEVRLLGTTIGGNLECNGAQFSNSNGDALSADGVQIKGDAFLGNGFKADGGVRLLGATIGGNLECDGAQFSNSNGYALSANRVEIKGGTYLRNGFKAEGGVYLVGAAIANLQIRGVLKPEKTILDLRSAKVGEFWDDERSWPRPGNLFLDGFRYERLYAESPTDAKNRKKWLQLQPTDKFLPQPYEQLAATLREMGHERDARLVLIQKNRERTRFTHFLGQKWWWYNFFGRAIGYGYAPWRAFAGSVLMIVLGWFLFAFGSSHDLISPAKESAYEKNSNGQFVLVNEKRKLADDYPVFNSFVYSLESFTPLLKLDQSATWTPNANHGAQVWLWRWQVTTGGLLRCYLWIHIIVGWVLTTLWVGAVTGLVKS